MDNEIKKYFHICKSVFGILFLVAVFWYISLYSKSVLPDRQFSVQGEGKAVAIPDIAQLSFGVLTEGGKNLADLQKKNSEKMNSIITFLKENGIEEKDIKTQYYNVSPRYESINCPAIYPSICPPAEIVGYTVQQSVSVKVRDLNKTGDILTGVVERGANNVSGPSFTVDNPLNLQNQARQEAIVKAKETAKIIAGAGGFRVGKLISIQEGFSYPVPLTEGLVREGAAGFGDKIAPIIKPGSQEITVNVTLIYEIK